MSVWTGKWCRAAGVVLAAAVVLASCGGKTQAAPNEAQQQSQADLSALESKIDELQAALDKLSDADAQAESAPAAPAAPTASVQPSADSFIRITSPSDGSERYLYNTTDVYGVTLTFTGEVSTDCTSIRVLWAPESADYIQAYLEGRSKKIEGIPIDDYVLSKFQPGDSTFIYNVGGSLMNLQQGSNFYRFIATFADGSTKSYSLSYYVYCGGAAEKAKPVIYLYPKKKTTVRVNVRPQGGVTESIPEIGSGWKVTAYPDGRITSGGEDYPYLYWESADNPSPIDMSEGFVVAEGDLAGFFEEKLSFLGLNEKEIADFCEYWVPELGGKPYVFITFYSRERIDAEAPLSVSPAPDSVIRVYFDHQKLDAPVDVAEQKLVPAQRSGFAVVEWGGRRYR